MFLKNLSLIRVSAAALAVMSLSNVLFAAAPVNSAEKERELIAILKSGASPDEKAITCKRLAVYGSAEAVPVLAPLLENPELASWARIALEAIPDESADAALRGAIPKVQGRLLIGTINSIGFRRDVRAISELESKLKDKDVEVGSAAAVALGRIGGSRAAGILKAALPTAPASLRAGLSEGCVRCAEHFLTDGQDAPAIELYDQVRKAEVPLQNRLEATRGAILARKNEGIPLLLEQLRSTDKPLFQIGLRTARELPGKQATDAVVAELHRSSQDRQPMLLLALADRGDDSALPTLFDAAKSGPKDLRVVAVRILDQMGKLSSVPTLIEVAAQNDAQLSQAALVALTRMPGNELDPQLVEQMKTAKGKTLQVLLELTARRQIPGAIPEIVKETQNSDLAVRSSAIQSLGTIGGPDQVNDLVKLLSASQPAKQRQEVETSLLAISARVGNGCAQYLVPLAHNQDSSVRKVALHALASAGGSQALATLKNAVEDKDEAVQDEAVRTLSTWPNTWPEDEAIAQPLLSLAQNSKKPNYQVLAMRGYLQFLQGDKKLKTEDKLTKIHEALPLITRPEEKRSAIAVLQSIPNAGSLETLVKLAQEPAVSEEACAAIVDLAGKRMPGVSSEARRLALQTPIEKSQNEETKNKAKEVLAKIR